MRLQTLLFVFWSTVLYSVLNKLLVNERNVISVLYILLKWLPVSVVQKTIIRPSETLNVVRKLYTTSITIKTNKGIIFSCNTWCFWWVWWWFYGRLEPVIILVIYFFKTEIVFYLLLFIKKGDKLRKWVLVTRLLETCHLQ